MKKVLKKSIEAEINSVLKNFFHHKNEDAAKKIEKSVNKVSKSLSKEFIKNVTKLKKARARKVAETKKSEFQISKSEKIYGMPSSEGRHASGNGSAPEKSSASSTRSTRTTTAKKRSSRSVANKAAPAKRTVKKRQTNNS